MECLTNLLDSSTMPWLTALLLGLMTAISPCPLATNITAIAYIGRNIENRKRVFFNGLFYTSGRAVTYTLLAVIIFLGADQLKLTGFFQKYGEKFIGPVLIIIGLLMFDFIRINLPGISRLTSGMEKKTKWNYFDAMLLGLVFALAFCPYSAVLYFGMLIPMTVSSPSGLYLPVVFALATGIPVIILAWFLAFTVSGTGRVYKKITMFESKFRKIIAAIFIIAGIYYLVRVYV